MKITLTSFGTLGDLLPYLALGRALQARGHQVVMAIAEGMLPYARRAKLHAVPCYPHHGPEHFKSRPMDFDHWPSDLATAAAKTQAQINASLEAEQNKWRENFDLKARINDLVAASKNADVLVCSSLVTGESVAAELASIPCLQAPIAPERLWQASYQRFIAELERESPPQTQAVRDHFEWVQRHRLDLGLPRAPSRGWKGYFWPASTLLGVSPLFLAPIDTSGWKAELCGFWFYNDPEDCAPNSDPEVDAFVANGPAPIVLTFSSLPLTQPDRILALHVEAARTISRPLVILSGWSGMAENNSLSRAKDVLVRSFFPLDWLLARAAAVIHHGGIGTTARALRSGCPMLVEPWGNDQFFNALLVLKNGVGVATNPKKLTAHELANLLTTKVLSKQIRDRAATLADGVRREEGIGKAVRLIEAHANR